MARDRVTKRGGDRGVLPPLPSALDTHSNQFCPDKDLSKLSEESKLLLEIIMEKFDCFAREIGGKIEAKDEKISLLEQQVINLKHENCCLTDRMDNIEARERNNSLIFSGSDLPAASATGNSVRVVQDVISRILKIKLSGDDIVSANRIGKKPATQSPDHRKILVKFAHRDIKMDLLGACRTLKPSGLYLNEDLIPVRAEVQFSLRKLKRKSPQLIAYVGSQNGSVFLWQKASQPGASNTKIFINSMAKLEEFCRKSALVDFSELVEKPRSD